MMPDISNLSVEELKRLQVEAELAQLNVRKRLVNL